MQGLRGEVWCSWVRVLPCSICSLSCSLSSLFRSFLIVAACHEETVAAQKAESAAIADAKKILKDTIIDWKNELEAVCVAFDKCFTDASKFYTNTLVPRLTAV